MDKKTTYDQESLQQLDVLGKCENIPSHLKGRLMKAAIVNISKPAHLVNSTIFKKLKSNIKPAPIRDVDGLEKWFELNTAALYFMNRNAATTTTTTTTSRDDSSDNDDQPFCPPSPNTVWSHRNLPQPNPSKSTTGPAPDLKQNFNKDISSKLLCLQSMKAIEGFNDDEFDLIKQVLEDKLMHMYARLTGKLDLLMDENTYISMVISTDFEFLKKCFLGLFDSRWYISNQLNENEVLLSQWCHQLSGESASARKADGILFSFDQFDWEIFIFENVDPPIQAIFESNKNILDEYTTSSFKKNTNITPVRKWLQLKGTVDINNINNMGLTQKL
ncbi:hypothetical protein BC937DRAFT_91119 [Endogone sp. FLAS-F59071]|nr:hypothetical protein BC937DRAFT_91119 [Endogone sp. FLAS-F59071]|eukprot:RUS16518.1 hypothetical protein BC937DRAFT_91119 [Endogone sp. FLAS-F59071]